MSRAAAANEIEFNRELFGERLARIRKQRGITQVELASLTGLIQVVISNFERGKQRPYGDTVAHLAVALSVTTDLLLGLSEDTQPKESFAKPLPRRLIRRLQAMDRLPKRDQDALLRTIDAVVSARTAK